VAVDHVPGTGPGGSTPSRRTCRGTSRSRGITSQPRRGWDPAGFHEAGAPGSIPGPGIALTLRVGWCSAEFHKLGRWVRFPYPHLRGRATRWAPRAVRRCSPGGTPPWYGGGPGSTPGRASLWVSKAVRKAAGYGWPGLVASECARKGVRVRIPRLPLDRSTEPSECDGRHATLRSTKAKRRNLLNLF
jgi:hypothetical protein